MGLQNFDPTSLCGTCCGWYFDIIRIGEEGVDSQLSSLISLFIFVWSILEANPKNNWMRGEQACLSFILHFSKTQGFTKGGWILFIFQASVTPGFISELAGLRLKTESFSAGAPLAEIFGQGQGSSSSSSLPQVIKYMPIWFKQKNLWFCCNLSFTKDRGQGKSSVEEERATTPRWAERSGQKKHPMLLSLSHDIQWSDICDDSKEDNISSSWLKRHRILRWHP